MGRLSGAVRGHKLQSQRARAHRDSRTATIKAQRRGEPSGYPHGGHGATGTTATAAIAPKRVTLLSTLGAADATQAAAAQLDDAAAAQQHAAANDGRMARLLERSAQRRLILEQFVDAVRLQTSAAATAAYLREAAKAAAESSAAPTVASLDFARALAAAFNEWGASPPVLTPAVAFDGDKDGGAEDGDEGQPEAGPSVTLPLAQLLHDSSAVTVLLATIAFLNAHDPDGESMPTLLTTTLTALHELLGDTGATIAAAANHHSVEHVIAEVLSVAAPRAAKASGKASSADGQSFVRSAQRLAQQLCANAAAIAFSRHGSRALVAALRFHTVSGVLGKADVPTVTAALVPDAQRLRRLVVSPDGIEVAMALADAAAAHSVDALDAILAATFALPSAIADGDLEDDLDDVADGPAPDDKPRAATGGSSGKKRGREEPSPSTATAAATKPATTAGSGGSLLAMTEAHKRLGRFVRHVLEESLRADVPNRPKAVAGRVAHWIARFAEAVLPDVLLASASSSSNFVVQALIHRCFDWLKTDAAGGASKADRDALGTVTETIAKTYVGHLDDVLFHPVACHCFAALCTAAANAGKSSAALGMVVAELQSRLGSLATNKHASLSLRRLVEGVSAAAGGATPEQKKSAQKGAATATIADAFIGALVAGRGADAAAAITLNEYGNLVVQAFLRCSGDAAVRDRFIREVIVPRAVAMAESNFAAHAVICALQRASPAVHMQLVGALKPHIQRLATHLNGRFVVQALVSGGHQECRDAILAAFKELVAATGTQHLLAQLYQDGDAALKRRIAAAVTENGVEKLASTQTSSIVLQRLLEVDKQQDATSARPVHDAIQAALDTDASLRQRLESSFFARFVLAFFVRDVAQRLERRQVATKMMGPRHPHQATAGRPPSPAHHHQQQHQHRR